MSGVKDSSGSRCGDDVRNTTENHLDIGIQSKPHFLGAVVLQQQSHSVAALETRLVIDGQQRLTTMQLLLDAVQEVFEQRDLREAATRLSFLVLNNDAFLGKDENNAFQSLAHFERPRRLPTRNAQWTADRRVSRFAHRASA